MLHAVGQKKSRIYQRYAGFKGLEEKRIPAEDEITSIIFGPLDFMADGEAFRFWQALLLSCQQNAFLPRSEPSRVVMKLWDRVKTESDGRWIEPDVVVKMYWPDGQFRIILLEIKWRARLSGDDQLRRQWLGYLDDEEVRASALHLYIGFEIGDVQGNLLGKSGKENFWATPEGGRLNFVSWARVRGVLYQLSRESTGLGRWAELSNEFLERTKVRRFRGFEHLCGSVTAPLSRVGNVFWQAKRFGWARMAEHAPVVSAKRKSVFFEGV